MRVKANGIRVGGIRPELLIAVMVANEVYTEIGKELVITSVTDGKHSDTSLHYTGCAFDCRIYDDSDMEFVITKMKDRLKIDYDVVLEGNHIHVEYQPRK